MGFRGVSAAKNQPVAGAEQVPSAARAGLVRLICGWRACAGLGSGVGVVVLGVVVALAGSSRRVAVVNVVAAFLQPGVAGEGVFVNGGRVEHIFHAQQARARVYEAECREAVAHADVADVRARVAVVVGRHAHGVTQSGWP